ncbi:NADH-quinone oxidoreductase subunit N [Capsulimonas corticalis]|uniref:NADH-quinone oxidoreductase subunit N n=1 Tax=Capsulimonas corticalis TaxID=2219043 RepID=A0A402CYD0_9BACT|nr:NADH-quinone oxidoreductase subunit N [Capsulimonas corticalis]BDI31368.1 NADH-quinone oxidoreductase subunit N [Capsulimonas corticalis]
MISIPSNDFFAVSPLLIVILTAMIVLMVDLALPRDRKGLLVGISLIGLVAAVFASAALWGRGLNAFAGSVAADNFAILFQFILLIVAGLSVLLSERYIQLKGINYGEYYALMLFSTSGAMLMATSRELITIFVGLEVLSIALYILAGFARTEARSEESAMKYFLLGAFSSGFFLYGIALLYGGTGTTRLDLMAQVPGGLQSVYSIAGMALLLVGLGFKAAIVPFHSWTPDVYEGAPTSVTAFMSAGAKAGAFAALIRVAIAFLPVSHYFHDVLWALAILTMIVGNIIAVQQTNIKRMLAYSSIAHAGYILVGLIAQNEVGRAGIIFYVLSYTFMNLGAFGILILLARRGDELTQIQDLEGLSERQPAAAALMAIFMLSLAGIPPTAGFIGKFFLFSGAIQAHEYWLASIGLLASVVGVFYYLWIIVRMYFKPARREFPTGIWNNSPGASIAVGFCALLSILLGLVPSTFYNPSLSGAQSLIAPVAPIAAPAIPVAKAEGPQVSANVR